MGEPEGDRRDRLQPGQGRLDAARRHALDVPEHRPADQARQRRLAGGLGADDRAQRADRRRRARRCAGCSADRADILDARRQADRHRARGRDRRRRARSGSPTRPRWSRTSAQLFKSVDVEVDLKAVRRADQQGHRRRRLRRRRHPAPRADYDKIRDRVRALPGTVFQEGEARARADPAVRPGAARHGRRGDQGGHRQQPGRVRGGRPGRARRPAAAVRQPAARHRRPVRGDRPQDARTTRPRTSRGVQHRAGRRARRSRPRSTRDAERGRRGAVAGEKQPSALVAIRVSDGAVLAVANGPDGGDVNLAFTGQVPPGSTFKMVSTLGLLDKRRGHPRRPRRLPEDHDRRRPHVQELARHGARHGAVPHRLRQVVQHRVRDARAEARRRRPARTPAAALGLGAKWDLGIDAFTGKVSPAARPTELAAAAFGQGTTRGQPARDGRRHRGGRPRPVGSSRSCSLDPAPAGRGAGRPAAQGRRRSSRCAR